MQVTISRNNQQFGPYTVDEINLYLKEGSLLPTDYAWHDGLTEWIILTNIEGVTSQTELVAAHTHPPSNIDSKVIREATPALREFLELSCLYLAAADQQFTTEEQQWVDENFGQGASERFTANFATAQWDQIFIRIHELTMAIPKHESDLIAEHIESFLKKLLSVDGLDSEEADRLKNYITYITDLGISVKQSKPESLIDPKPITSEPPKEQDADEIDAPIKLAINEINIELGSPLPPILSEGVCQIEIKPIDEYPPIYSHYKEYESTYGPYVFEKVYTYDYEGKNPEFYFEGAEAARYSHDDLKWVWTVCYASKKQNEKLKKAGVNFGESAITFKQAAWAIEKLDEAKKVVAAKKRAINAVKPATKNTLKKMDELGVKYKEGVTRAEADRLIEKHWEKVAKDEFKTNLKLAKERGLDVDSKIDPFELSELIHDDAAPTPEQNKKLNDFNSVITRYGGRPQNFRNLNSDNADYHLDLIEEAINWATGHSDIDGDYVFEDEKQNHYYSQQRPLTPNEITALNEGCMKKIQKMIEEEDSYCEEERDIILLKVAKAAFKKEKHGDDW